MDTSTSYSILIVTATTYDSQPLSRAFTESGDVVATVSSASEGRALHRRTPFDAILVVVPKQQVEGRISFVQEIVGQENRVEVVVMALAPSLKQAVSLTKLGAYDYMSASSDIATVVSVVHEAAEQVRTRRLLVVGAQEHTSPGFLRAFLSSSVPAGKEMARALRNVASHGNAPTLIWGETGAGKRAAATAMHQLGERAGARIVHLNLIDEDAAVVHKKLFGTADNPGLIHAARGGTLIIREIAHAPRSLQETLALVLETRLLPEDGAFAGQPLQTRIVATSSYAPEELLMEHGIFPRLLEMFLPNTVRILSLRERGDDFPVLLDVMFREIAAEAGRPAPRLMPEALNLLASEKWYGNLRELHNVLTRLMLLSEKEVIDVDELLRIRGGSGNLGRGRRVSGSRPTVRAPSVPKRPSSSSVPRISGAVVSVLDQNSRAERERIEQALEITNGHRERAAALLGMSRTTLWTRMRMLGIDYRRFRKTGSRA